jgi:hypothetical protein
MSELPVITQADLDWEAAGTEKATRGRESFFTGSPTRTGFRELFAVSTADPTLPVAVQPGLALISRRPLDLQKRYETFLRHEKACGDRAEQDFGILINYACALLEAEIDALLLVPAQRVARELVDVVGRKSPEYAAMLQRWASGGSAATLGTASQVLGALWSGHEAGDNTVAAFLDEHFRPEFADLIRANRLARNLDAIRLSFRNPACHGQGTFRVTDYDAFSRRLVGHGRISYWEKEGPLPATPPESDAVLHRLLAGSRSLPDLDLPPAAGRDDLREALARLSRLARPRDEGLAVSILPARVKEGSRDLAAAEEEEPFRLGDPICFCIRAAVDCHLVVIDVGTAGGVAAALPNRWVPSPRLAAGQTHRLPGPEFPGFSLRLSGVPGRERVVAVATREPLRVPLRPRGSDAFRELDARTLDAVTEAVAALPPADWGVAVAEFGIVPR